MSDRDRDFAALALRTAIGPMLVLHGHNKVFGAGGLKGTTGWFDSLGLQPAAVHARMAAATEIGAGTLITLGALNPLPSAAVVGLMATAAATDHRGKGFFVFKGGWEYTGVVALAATALAGLGHGRWSADRLLRRKQRSGAGIAVAAAALGLAGAGILLATSYRPPSKDVSEVVEPPSEDAEADLA
ncbi:MAG TPA: DoxX family protein [Acidimicrobiales bacterium]|jgi:putative oxidoreductase|nr:DoxX family protein [Acidimicrobiales bacterium]